MTWTYMCVHLWAQWRACVEHIAIALWKASLMNLCSNTLTSTPTSIILGEWFNCTAHLLGPLFWRKKKPSNFCAYRNSSTESFSCSLLCLWHLLPYTWQFNVTKKRAKENSSLWQARGKRPRKRNWVGHTISKDTNGAFYYFVLTTVIFFLNSFLKGNPI